MLAYRAPLQHVIYPSPSGSCLHVQHCAVFQRRWSFSSVQAQQTQQAEQAQPAQQAQQPQNRQVSEPAGPSAPNGAHAPATANDQSNADPSRMLRIAQSAAQQEAHYRSKLQEAQASCSTRLAFMGYVTTISASF